MEGLPKATVCDWEAFAYEKPDWLTKFVALKNGVLSHDCIAYTLSRVSVTGFQECFANWVEGARQHSDGEIIAIDGECARRSHDRKKNKSPLQRVSAWASANRLALGQQAKVLVAWDF